MFELKPVCENCNKSLPADSQDARICTFECTWCVDCAENILFNVCPNCGGGLEKRPIRTKEMLKKHPAQIESHYNPVDFNTPNPRRDRLIKYKGIPPHLR